MKRRTGSETAILGDEAARWQYGGHPKAKGNVISDAHARLFNGGRGQGGHVLSAALEEVLPSNRAHEEGTTFELLSREGRTSVDSCACRC